MCFTRRKTKQEIHNPRTCVIEVHTEQDSGGYGVGGVGCCGGGGGGGGGGNFSDDGYTNIRRGGKNQDHDVRADDYVKKITTGRNIEDHDGDAKSGGSGRQNDCVPPADNDITGGGGGNDIQGSGHRREIDQKADAKGGGNYNSYVGEKTEGGADHVSHTKPTAVADAEPSAGASINESPTHSVKDYRYARPPSAINFAPAAPVVNFYVHSLGEDMNRGCTIM